MIEIKNFTASEFDCPSLKGSGGNMRISTLEMLQKARDIYGLPMKINSGFRTAQRNKLVGGATNSAHLGGYAVDIASNDKADLLKALYAAGFRRFGIMANAIHVDNDPNKNNSVWSYPTTNKTDWQLFGTLEKIKAL